jgi:hypothetical protein
MEPQPGPLIVNQQSKFNNQKFFGHLGSCGDGRLRPSSEAEGERRLRKSYPAKIRRQ